ncbi:SBF-like CPA transporter family-domain-containing protein [Yarrowia lipolytica]|jgi:sodium/bile acid cotransporter 7|uniref:YALI0B10956p n=2 Tax=Yarrowia lipolytica TaxID=4952 RepID=Q6CF22_YARLI|nr:YALI0B10956p [Yarrowia lipolytica CLIB122]AOW01529.1 hypothetical protein YALI1_B14645g [Yarrowia lipolytica]KAB8281101.1 SBF-like CPA transporter family-domain-containing protein [Yarrowia lipolytica]KAE8170331.1 SBF-like CPA transporter family-domain-containing protein [Yarrowia lipolytica]KAJ8052345.1 SBF-like CPA transporter family-domain-containing protein [Yarrowia lipolytica]RDW28642.1 SBF-like CPA transporter family-domain-containing protein [Yarrowia lipolytica]|eukprot:XP_500740.1 YALI0B10956p [Yarrowia lipolytica CLIB122]
MGKLVDKLMKVINFLISQWFIIGMGVAVAIAYAAPNYARSGGMIRSDITIEYLAVAAIFLISGLSMPSRTLLKELGNWRAHLITQGLSFLVTPALMFGFVKAIYAADDPRIDKYVLVGMIICGCTPTTVSSNVVMTRNAGGNDSLSLLEVTIGNVMGAFVSPALLQLYLSDSTGFGFGNPAKDSSMTELYRRVMKQLGLSLFVPLFVGQVVQNVFPTKTKWVVTKFKLAKLGTFCLLLLIWATFSTSFYDNAFESVPKATMIMVPFFNIGIYLLFTVICFACARSPIPRLLAPHPPTEVSSRPYKLLHRFISGFYFNKRNTVAIMLCGAAKTVALGVPLINAQYGSGSSLVGRVSIPLTLFQGEQILTAQLLVPIFKRWIGDEGKEPENEFDDITVNSKSSNDLEKAMPAITAAPVSSPPAGKDKSAVTSTAVDTNTTGTHTSDFIFESESNPDKIRQDEEVEAKM